MTRPIRLHWASSKPNFGDRLSPLICERVSGRPVTHATVRGCDVVALGSILQRVPESVLQRRVRVWGAGFIAEQKLHRTRHHLHALRGFFSARCISNIPADAIYGDPGLLANLLVDSLSSSIRYDVAVVPHYKDKESDALKDILSALPKNTVVVDVFDDPLSILRTLAASRFVLASAMHGLIASDALEVPNAWLKLSSQVRGDDFKFRDYYSVFDIDPVAIEGAEDLDLTRQIAHYSRPGLARIRQELIASFPEV